MCRKSRKQYVNKMKKSIERELKNKPKRNSEADEYNYWNGKFTRGIQRQIWTGRRLCELKDRAMEVTEADEQKEKKIEKKQTEPKGPAHH